MLINMVSIEEEQNALIQKKEETNEDVVFNFMIKHETENVINCLQDNVGGFLSKHDTNGMNGK